MSDELVSIILPTYNRRALLQEAIASIQGQSRPHWELLIVDDGSTDGSPDVVPRDDRIRLMTRPHVGNVALLRNVGLDVARGSIVAFLDSDDRWHPHKLARQVARLRVRQESGWCYGQYNLIDESGQQIPQRRHFPWIPREGTLLREMLTTEAGVSLLTVAVRRELADALRFDEHVPWGDDYDFLVRLASTAPACVVDEVIADVREHSNRGNRHRYDQMLNFAAAYRRYERDLPDPVLKHICRQRASRLMREYLANARADGALIAGMTRAARAWWLRRV